MPGVLRFRRFFRTHQWLALSVGVRCRDVKIIWREIQYSNSRVVFLRGSRLQYSSTDSRCIIL